MSNFSELKYLSANAMFQTIYEYQQLKLSNLLGQILQDRQIDVIDLHKLLDEYGYYLNVQSLYRYFNNSSRSNRFPPQDFIRVFAKILYLTEEETKLLLIFWHYCKFYKKCNYWKS
jgi:hypothetical protein